MSRNELTIREGGPWSAPVTLKITQHNDGDVSLRLPAALASELLTSAEWKALDMQIYCNKNGSDQVPKYERDMQMWKAAQALLRKIRGFYFDDVDGVDPQRAWDQENIDNWEAQFQALRS